MNERFQEADERGLIEGACGYCANAFDGIEGVEAVGIDVIGDADEHGPDLGAVVDQGFDVMTIG